MNNEGFTPETGIQKIRTGLVDAIAFGKYSMNNYDFPERILNNYTLANAGTINW